MQILISIEGTFFLDLVYFLFFSLNSMESVLGKNIVVIPLFNQCCTFQNDFQSNFNSCNCKLDVRSSYKTWYFNSPKEKKNSLYW